jgi:mono/diheme cytochrome c family protein
MKTAIKQVLIIAALVLAGCGGGQPGTERAPQLAAMSGGGALQQDVSAYNDVVQRVYVAYFGRPADPAGLAYYAGLYQSSTVAPDMVSVSQAYDSNATVKALVDSFAASDESSALYPGSNDVFVAAVYRNLYNRDPDAAGGAYWIDLLDRGLVTRANAALSIMAGSQGSDADLITRKSQVAAAFTAAVNTDARKAGYSGLAANAVVRTMLGTVTTDTDLAAFGSTIEATLDQLAPAPTSNFPAVQTIINQRCVGCHSATPTIPGFSPAPLGIMFDTSEQIHANAEMIYQNAVQSHFMPYGNRTGMTDAERATVGAWYTSGAL